MATITMESPLNTHPCTGVSREILSTQLPGIQKKEKRKEDSPQRMDMTSVTPLKNPHPSGHAQGLLAAEL